MLVITGVWLSVLGALAAIAGLADRRRVQRLRRTGVMDWATVVARAIRPGERPDGSSPAIIQFPLADGRVVERILSRSGRAVTPEPGQKILVWYDPADPADVLVYGRYGTRVDRFFIAVGCILLVAGAALASLAH
jgi:Protein of unknown function (DUF3592)